MSSAAERLGSELVYCAAIFVATVVVFSPVLWNGYVNWDDFANIVDNPHYRGLTLEQLKWMFTTFYVSLYRPVTWVTFGLDYIFWGTDPFGYHLTSLLIHGINAALFYLIALRLLRAALMKRQVSARPLRFGAGCAALFFSLHPLRAEAVAWISARNDVVSGLFFLLTILCYLRAASFFATSLAKYRLWLFATFMIYSVSLLSKANGMTLPLALLILDIYPLQRMPTSLRQFSRPGARRVLLEKIPLLLVAAAAGVVAFLAKEESHAVYSLAKHGWLLRIGLSCYALVFYLWKTIIPLGLSPLYQLASQPNPWEWSFVLSAMIVGAITAGLFAMRKRYPALLASWAGYAVLLIPMLGIVSFGPQVVADRYTYLSCLVWPLWVGAGAVNLAQFPPRYARLTNRLSTSATLLLLLLVGLGFLSWQASQVWHDSERLWRRVLAINPAASYAYHNLAAERQLQGNIEGAIEYYRKAVEIDPRFARAYHNLGDLYGNRGAFELAVQSYRKAIEIDPQSVDTYHNLANLLARQGKTDEALRAFEKALEINPSEASVHNDIGNLLVERGDLDSASRHFHKSADLDPASSAPWFNLGNLMVRVNRLDQAIVYFGRAVEINPDYAEAHNNLGRLLAAQGNLDEAVDRFRAAVRINPRFAEAYQGLIQALTEQGKKEEAFRQYQIARRILQSPDPPSNKR